MRPEAVILNSIQDDEERKRSMRITIIIDNEQLARATAATGLRSKSALVREALTALIEREAALRLTRLGGSEPGLGAAPPRRRTAACK